MVNTQTKFKFKSYRVIKSEFTINPNFKSDSILNVTFSNCRCLENDSEYTLCIQTSITNNERSLSVNLEIEGYFEFNKTLQGVDKENFFKYNAPAILFPYIRAHISSLTALCGIEPIVLPTLNFANLLNK